MRFGLIHRVMTDSLAALGILALVTSGKLHVYATVLVLLGMAVGIFLPVRFRQQALVKVAAVAGPLAILGVQLLRLFLGGDPIPIVVEFAAGLQVLRLISRRGAAHDHQVILLALLHLIAGTVLGGGLTYAVALFGFLIFTPGALVLSHLRREVEGNYRQGARDRTGMPVDVPRILRSRRVIGRGFLLFTCSLSIPVFAISALLFMLFPRVGFAWLSVPPIEPSRVVGFSNRVDLGGVGTIRTDPTLVMRVKPSDMGDEPALRRNLYLRGAVFDTYDGRSWARTRLTRDRPSEFMHQVILRRAPRPTDRTMLIDLERIDPPVVFLPGETVAIDVLSGNRRPRMGGSLVTSDESGQLLYSPLEREGLSYRAYLPQAGLIVPEREHPEELHRYLTLPEGLSPKIRKLAIELAGTSEKTSTIALSIEKALRTRYTYDLSSPSGAAADPLEDFLFNSKRGHCEFYSTAMAVMLRVVGVPSRNVTGFVGGTYNRFGNFYAVRQGDAHSWVEAYLPDRGWVRFDPTPPSSAIPQARTQGAFAVMREILEAASQSWRQNVEGFDMAKQVGIINSIREALRKVPSPSMQSKKAGWSKNRVFLLMLGVLFLAGAGAVYWRLRRQQSLDPTSRHAPQAALALSLYQQLERALIAQGVPRPIATPPLTHAQALVAAGHPTGPEAEALVRIYLAVRFGDAELSAHQAEDFAQRVALLSRLQPAGNQAA